MAGERVRYICPICDHELKFGKHYCWNCKSRVESPWRYTGGHLPNEGHEAGCHPPQTYMAPRSGAAAPRSHGGRNLAGKNNASKQYTYNQPAANRTASYGGTTARTNAPQKRNTGCGTLILVGFIFWFIIQVMIGLMYRF